MAFLQKLKMKHCLITGCAGFIGFHVAKALIARGDRVVGYDNFNDYYSVSLKKSAPKDFARIGCDHRRRGHL